MPECSQRGGHQFPADIEYNNRLVRAVRRAADKRESHWTSKPYMVVCYSHFVSTDYITKLYKVIIKFDYT